MTFDTIHMARSTDNGRPMKSFSLKFKTFGLGQTNWVNKFWGIWGTCGQTISTHFGTVSSLSMVSIIELVFLQELSLYIHISNICLDWDLNLGREELGIYFSCVRIP